MRSTQLFIALILLAAVSVAAQEPPPEVTPGKTVLGFPHSGTNTDEYKICTASQCQTAPVTGTAPDLRLVVPTWVPIGEQELHVQACNEWGCADGPAGTFRVHGQLPDAPGALSVVP